MNKLKILIIITFAFLLNYQSFAQLFGSQEKLVTMKSFSSFEQIQQNSEFKLAFELEIAKTWHINSNKPNEDFLIKSEINISKSQNFEIVTIVYPKAKDIKFSFSDKPVSVYEGKETIGVVMKSTKNIPFGEYKIPIEFVYQACNDITCMAPESIFDTIKISVVDNQTAINEINYDFFSNLDLSYSTEQKIETDDNSLVKTLESSGMFLSLLIVFLGGLALNLTPCVYPLIPITIGFFGGQSEGNTTKLFFMGLFYLLGMALTYSVVGVVTALSGAVFGTLMQNPYVIIGIVLVLILLSLSQFGVYEFKLPDSWTMKAGGAKNGYFGAFFMGLTMGIVAAPCIGPFVLGLVTVVATKADLFYGFIMFFTLAVGLGFPYLILAVFSGKIKNLPRSGFWMEAVKHIFGLLLLGMALYFASPLIPKEVNTYILPIFMIISATFLLFFDKTANDRKGFRIFKNIFSVILMAISFWMLIPTEKQSPDWQYYTNQGYEQAISSNQKIVIDFYADWCIPCKELDALTFSDKNVISKMNEFKSFKVDMTKSASEETEQIRQKFSIVGMPTVLIIDSKGNEIKRITGFVKASEFLDILNSVK